MSDTVWTELPRVNRCWTADPSRMYKLFLAEILDVFRGLFWQNLRCALNHYTDLLNELRVDKCRDVELFMGWE